MQIFIVFYFLLFFFIFINKNPKVMRCMWRGRKAEKNERNLCCCEYGQYIEQKEKGF